MKQPRKRGIKPENSKTVNQWGLRGRIPVDPLEPQYIWDNYYDVPQTIYYLEENTREMTEEEKADFRADRKVFSQRYVKLIADERERLRKKARERLNDGSADRSGTAAGALPREERPFGSVFRAGGAV